MPRYPPKPSISCVEVHSEATQGGRLQQLLRSLPSRCCSVSCGAQGEARQEATPKVMTEVTRY